MTNQEIIKEIIKEHSNSRWSDTPDFDDSEYLEEVEADEWTQNHKHQYRQVIYWSTKHCVFIAVNEARSGSYHTDWHYEDPDVSVVRKVEEVVTKTVINWVNC
ncbi:hypothetical protein fHeYen901_87 [Yersinia phage fHe-Yen9-01]|uniref:Uncharacterized protein n=1 Tax=Yersinia phage fHe-Yen9-01 TaxID=1965363 RepID=A0A1V0DXI5_9CAUD|nr:ribonucleotide reductase [Yersinia phage fHe-Yen9-01]ARB05860.1 hypothetical protein fHeYen901_87 [Yersinia phage fHe-Yen9-01]